MGAKNIDVLNILRGLVMIKPLSTFRSMLKQCSKWLQNLCLYGSKLTTKYDSINISLPVKTFPFEFVKPTIHTHIYILVCVCIYLCTM